MEEEEEEGDIDLSAGRFVGCLGNCSGQRNVTNLENKKFDVDKDEEEEEGKEREERKSGRSSLSRDSFYQRKYNNRCSWSVDCGDFQEGLKGVDDALEPSLGDDDDGHEWL